MTTNNKIEVRLEMINANCQIWIIKHTVLYTYMPHMAPHMIHLSACLLNYDLYHVKTLFGFIYAKGEISDRVDISNLSKLKLKLKVTQSLNIWLFSALKPTVTLSLISQMNNSLAESFIQIWHIQSSILLRLYSI